LLIVPDLPLGKSGLRYCHVSSGSGTRLPNRKGSGTATCTVAPDVLGGLRYAACPARPDPASLLGGLQAVMRPAVPCGPRATNIKKALAGLSMWQRPPVPNARAHIFKTPDVRAIMSLQDIRAGSAVHAYKTCGYAATVQHRPC
jgi:hypothetical protein